MIGVDVVRMLTLSQPAGEERSRHISAASSLVRRGDLLYVVADDMLQLGVFPAEGRDHGYLVDIVAGDLPADHDRRQKEKPDFEALTEVDPFGPHEHGALLVFGSGSGRGRGLGSVLPLAEDGHPTKDYDDFDLSPLYEWMSHEVGELNVEGAVNWGERFVLLNRGNDPGSKNACVFLDMSRTLAGIEEHEAITNAVVEDVRVYDRELGQHRGPPLCFSDASPLRDGRVVFSASTEDDIGGGPDGRTEGSALGIFDANFDMELVEPIDLVEKVEGVTARITDEGVEVLMVLDADDPDAASPLLRTVL